MRTFMMVLAAAFALAMSSAVVVSTAEAASHVSKGKPGKCGTGKFYSKADKGCVAK